MEIFKAEFIKGVIGDDYSAGKNLPQVAFLGRSNSGKSSVINSLLNRKNLVKSSKIPGKTRQANFFSINDSFYFVDFPGYGYAKCSIKTRNKMIERILWYIRSSKIKPKVVVLIIDSNVGLTILDQEMISLLKENNHPLIVVANKIDKMNIEKAEKQISFIQKQLPGILVLPYSAKTKKNREETLEKITSLI
jgi:GTP-binding protein